jgi:hypothetical protein
LNITIHNQYPDLQLTSPVYCSKNATCRVFPSQQVGFGTTVEASFGIDFMQNYYEGALLYKLQRNHITETDNQSNSSATSIKNAAANMYLLVIWDTIDSSHKFCVCLIECTNDFTWDEGKLCTLYKEYEYQFCRDYKSRIITWLMHGDAVMKTRFDITYGSGYNLDIIISEGIGKYSMVRPMKINSKRSVLSLSRLFVLIYAVSLFEELVKLNIHNQCLNVDLVSPIYNISYGLECHRSPDHKVCAGDAARSDFIIKDTFERSGALIYKLQKRQTHESTETDKSTSSNAHLLVIWGIYEHKELLYADVLLVEHDKGFILSSDRLENLYHENFRLEWDLDSAIEWFTDSAKKTWLMDDNTVLMTTFEIMNEDFILNITISEVERDNSTRMLAHIDPKR